MMLRQISFADNNVGKENGQLTVAKGSAGLSARKGKGLGARKGRLPPSTLARRSTCRLRSPARQAVPVRAAPHSSVHTHPLPSCLRNPTFCALACCRPLARALQKPPVRQLYEPPSPPGFPSTMPVSPLRIASHIPHQSAISSPPSVHVHRSSPSRPFRLPPTYPSPGSPVHRPHLPPHPSC